MMTTTNTRTNRTPTMIPAIQPPVHPCAEGVPGDEVVCSLVVGDVVEGRVGAIVVAISGIKEHAELIGFNIMKINIIQ